MPLADPDRLGAYLRARRAHLAPSALGFAVGRRRTPGLRREEVAQRANISATWYTWLEQGRGGAPSADVLDRIAGALNLTELEREHLFLLGLGRPPEARYRGTDGFSPRLQRLLDALPDSPALIRTATWDVLAWNRAALSVLGDFSGKPPAERNMLRMMFLDPRLRMGQSDWNSVARAVVAAFRLEATRAGAEITPMVEALSQQSAEFAAIWRDHDLTLPGHSVKHLRHPVSGTIALEISTFAVDGRQDLSLIIYNPATPADRASIRALMDDQSSS